MRNAVMLTGLLLLTTTGSWADNVPAPDPLPKPNLDWTDESADDSAYPRDERREGSRRSRDMFRGGPSTWRVRVLNASGLARIYPEDEVVVVRCPTSVTVELPPVMSGVEGRVLVIKAAADAGDDIVVRGTDAGDLKLEPAQSLMLVSSSQLREWLAIARF